MATTQPDAAGFFGGAEHGYGGVFVPDALKSVLADLAKAFESAKNDPQFQKEYDELLANYVGRPNPTYLAKNLTAQLGGAKIYLKREDLNHTGAHKINNTIGQVMLAKRMGKKRVIAETGAGQHGVATATVCALFNLQCVIYMGAVDCQRQALNVFRMRTLGAEVKAVQAGGATLKDAVDAALMDLVQHADSTFYLLGSAVGPHPYPHIVHHFQSVISREAKRQLQQQEGRLPDYAIACVGGGSNAIGLFSSFIPEKSVKLVGVEPLGRGSQLGQHAATLCLGKPGVIHGFKCYLLQDDKAEPAATHSVAAGLDYPGVGPEHSYMKDTKRAEYVAVTDDEALQALETLAKTEGIIPALESSHAVAYAIKLAPTLAKDKILLVNLSGRGDKDMEQIAKMKGIPL